MPAPLPPLYIRQLNPVHTVICYFFNISVFRCFSQNFEKATISFVMSIRLSVRMEQIETHWKDFHEIWYLRIFRKTVEKINFHLNLTGINGTFHGYLCTFMAISSWILTKLSNISDSICWENQNKHFMLNNSPPPPTPENLTVCGVIRKNMVEPDRPQMTVYAAQRRCDLHAG